MISPQNDLLGYWVIDSATENTEESSGVIYLRFTGDGLLQWGYEIGEKIYVRSFAYRIEDENIANICSPNPRQELTPFSFTDNGKLKINYANYETIWAKTKKRAFFDKGTSWDSGSLDFRQIDYMSQLDLPPSDFQIKRAAFYRVSPQIMVNTDALWAAWQYSLAQFGSFHADDFIEILSRGVLASKNCNLGCTLLKYIVSDGHLEVIEPMLDGGFDVNADDILGKTALDTALFRNRTEIFELLRKRGAKLGSELKTAN